MTQSSIAQSTAHAHEHAPQYLEQFKALLRIPSISTDPAHRQDIVDAADWVVAEMQRIGLHNARAIATMGHPVVYGEWLGAGAEAPTILFYAHPYAAWERGSNENANRMIRRFIAKGRDLARFTHKAIQDVARWINNYPRRILHFMSPHALFTIELNAIA